MRATRDGVELHVGVVCLGAWVAWALVGALLPIAPWRVDRVLRLEEATAARLVQASAALDDWSIDVGGQSQAGGAASCGSTGRAPR